MAIFKNTILSAVPVTTLLLATGDLARAQALKLTVKFAQEDVREHFRSSLEEAAKRAMHVDSRGNALYDLEAPQKDNQLVQTDAHGSLWLRFDDLHDNEDVIDQGIEMWRQKTSAPFVCVAVMDHCLTAELKQKLTKNAFTFHRRNEVTSEFIYYLSLQAGVEPEQSVSSIGGVSVLPITKSASNVSGDLMEEKTILIYEGKTKMIDAQNFALLQKLNPDLSDAEIRSKWLSAIQKSGRKNKNAALVDDAETQKKFGHFTLGEKAIQIPQIKTVTGAQSRNESLAKTGKGELAEEISAALAGDAEVFMVQAGYYQKQARFQKTMADQGPALVMRTKPQSAGDMIAVDGELKKDSIYGIRVSSLIEWLNDVPARRQVVQNLFLEKRFVSVPAILPLVQSGRGSEKPRMMPVFVACEAILALDNFVSSPDGHMPFEFTKMEDQHKVESSFEAISKRRLEKVHKEEKEKALEQDKQIILAGRTDASESNQRVVCISDIHGNLEQLKKLWNNLVEKLGNDFESTPIVFLGDYCDRGPNCRGVLDFLIEKKNIYKNLRFLAGNHDFGFAAFIGALPSSVEAPFDLESTFFEKKEQDSASSGHINGYNAKEEKFMYWPHEVNGGMHAQGRVWAQGYGHGTRASTRSTFESYGVSLPSKFGAENTAESEIENVVPARLRTELIAAVPEAHAEFLKNLEWYAEIEVQWEKSEVSKVLCMHAGLNNDKAVATQLEAMQNRDLNADELYDTEGTLIPGGDHVRGKPLFAFGRESTSLLLHPELMKSKDTLQVSGHYGYSFASGNRIVLDRSAGDTESSEEHPMEAIILPERTVLAHDGTTRTLTSVTTNGVLGPKHRLEQFYQRSSIGDVTDHDGKWHNSKLGKFLVGAGKFWKLLQKIANSAGNIANQDTVKFAMKYRGGLLST
jgi:hypothetical protein